MTIDFMQGPDALLADAQLQAEYLGLEDVSALAASQHHQSQLANNIFYFCQICIIEFFLVLQALQLNRRDNLAIEFLPIFIPLYALLLPARRFISRHKSI